MSHKTSKAQRMKPRDFPLNVKVSRDGVLTISIGIDTLAFSALRCPFAWKLADEHNPDRPGTVEPDTLFRISNARGFAVDVKRELTAEREDGSSLLTYLLDKATQRAIEEGSEFWFDKSEDE